MSLHIDVQIGKLCGLLDSVGMSEAFPDILEEIGGGHLDRLLGLDCQARLAN